MTSPFDKYKQRQALSEKHQQMKIPVELIKIQDRYNKHNIELQCKFNLEIFEKQAELTREIHKKQSRLTIFLAVLTVLCSFIGIILGIYIERSWQHKTLELQSQKSITQYQDKVSTKGVPVHSQKDTKTMGQGESSLTNIPSKKSP
jgi:hypothetical protein